MKLEIQRRLAENLKRLRKERKLTQFELAEKANISEAMIKSVELCLS
ncbi:MAG: helix-turn-helix transcriptional regulator [Spirochaetaceae bacterium]|nr:helix-turn-helix transcriptional regulator [Spirochaetaceae bacterium]